MSATTALPRNTSPQTARHSIEQVGDTTLYVAFARPAGTVITILWAEVPSQPIIGSYANLIVQSSAPSIGSSIFFSEPDMSYAPTAAMFASLESNLEGATQPSTSTSPDRGLAVQHVHDRVFDLFDLATGEDFEDGV